MGVEPGLARTVLVADDTAFVRDRFSSALAEAGHRPVAVSTAGELLARVRAERERIHLILLDLHLPQSRGPDLVRAIRQYDGGQIPVVVFSGTVASADEVRDLVGLGIAGYVNEYSAPHHILPALAPHLYPDNFNRRASQRVGVSLPVSYRIGNTIASAVTLAIGKGGLSVRTMSPLESGLLAHVRFRLPGSARDVEADARVCWADRNIGMGLQFERLAADDQSAIDAFVDSHFFSNRKR
jgi:CheY-like chemotaxis protein